MFDGSDPWGPDDEPKMHQCCCAQIAPSGGLDGNRYRLMEIDEGPKQLGPCGLRREPGERCRAEMGVANNSVAPRCYNQSEYDVPIQEGMMPLCLTHYQQHVAGDWLWVYLPPL